MTLVSSWDLMYLGLGDLWVKASRDRRGSEKIGMGEGEQVQGDNKAGQHCGEGVLQPRTLLGKGGQWASGPWG